MHREESVKHTLAPTDTEPGQRLGELPGTGTARHVLESLSRRCHCRARAQLLPVTPTGERAGHPSLSQEKRQTSKFQILDQQLDCHPLEFKITGALSQVETQACRCSPSLQQLPPPRTTGL